jgi:competence protein ComEA
MNNDGKDNRWWKLVLGLIGGLLIAGLILLVSGSPHGTAVTLLPPPTPGPILVHVAGAVAGPGVYTLPAGSRVQDAVQAAGGLLPQADPNNINMAAFVQDGDQVIIPTLPPTPLPESQATPGTDTRAPGMIVLININTATQTELESLPEIGPAIAQKIIEYRQKNGPFKKIEDIMKVPGIGEKIFEAIKQLITV